MHSARFGLLLLLSLISIPMRAQQVSVPPNTVQTPEQAAQAAALIQQSLTAQTGASQLSDIILSGSVTIMQGANKGSGTVVYAASAGGKSRGTLTMPSGRLNLFRDYSASPRIGTSIGPDGTSKNVDPLDMMGPHPAWYFPAFIMASVSSTSYASADMGQETQNAAPVRHVAILPKYGPTVTVPTMALQQPGQQDLYLDPLTLLPVALSFNLVGSLADKKVTPFRKIDLYAPEEVRFSDYRLVQGLPVAFHIQVYMNKILVMEIQFSSVNVNTGVVISAN
jgi:hypothetical protein